MATPAVNMTRARSGVWIMKLPRFLMEHIASGHAAGSPLGQVQASGENKYSLTLNDAPPGLPREYEMSFTASPPATYVISQPDDSTGSSRDGPQHEGRAEAKGEIKPRDSSEYRTLLKERTDKAGKRREVAITEDDTGINRALKGELGHRQHLEEEKAQKNKRQQRLQVASSKRARVSLSSREVKEMVMQLFSEQRYWSRGALVQRTGNPDALGKVLDEICDKVTKKGPQYNDYELKHHLAGMAKASGSGSGLPNADAGT